VLVLMHAVSELSLRDQLRERVGGTGSRTLLNPALEMTPAWRHYQVRQPQTWPARVIEDQMK